MGGFSVEAIVGALGGTPKPLIDAIAAGTIRGAVGIVGCNNPRIKQDCGHVTLTQRLIENDILVMDTGCASVTTAKAGFKQAKALEREGVVFLGCAGSGDFEESTEEESGCQPDQQKNHVRRSESLPHAEEVSAQTPDQERNRYPDCRRTALLLFFGRGRRFGQRRLINNAFLGGLGRRRLLCDGFCYRFCCRCNGCLRHRLVFFDKLVRRGILQRSLPSHGYYSSRL